MEKGGCKETITHCTDIGTHLHIIAAYLPWINDLLEQNNCILLNASKQLCVPNQGEDEYEKMEMTDIPKNWPDHLDAAIKNLSDCIFPSLKFSPNKLLINIPTIISPSMDPEDITLPTDSDVLLHLSIMEQQHLNGYNSVVNHAAKQKDQFDTKVNKHTPRNVILKKVT